MCIRDSARRLGATIAWHPLKRADDLNGAFAAISRDGADGPVSYTHLRAHETVLDLVCRLLLENKKESIHEQSSH